MNLNPFRKWTRQQREIDKIHRVQSAEAARAPMPASAIQVLGDREWDAERRFRWDIDRGKAQGIYLRRSDLPTITPDTKIFTIGSCFAVRIRDEMRQRGFAMYPDFSGIEIDPARHKAGELPREDNITYFDPCLIRQEMQLVVDDRNYPPDAFWELPARLGVVPKKLAWRDPYRRSTYGKTRDDLGEISGNLSQAIRQGVHASDLFVITLGIAEVLRDLRSGLVICHRGAPTTAKMLKGQDVGVEMLDYPRACEELKQTIALIRQVRPGAQVVLTVSPIYLSKTYSEHSIAHAAVYGKALLRAAVESVIDPDDGVFYFPSFEYVQLHDGYTADGRHVRDQVVEHIVDAFVGGVAKA